MKVQVQYSILLIVDEKISSSNQVIGLAEAIKIHKKEIKIKILYSHKLVPTLLPNWMIYYLLKVNLINVKSKFEYEKINLIISCGRVSSPLSLFIKEKTQCKNIHILDPYFKRKEFDKIIIPKHDKYKKSDNYIEIIGAIVNNNNKKISLENIKFFKKKLSINKNKKSISVLLGGSGKSSEFSLSDIRRLIEYLQKIDRTTFQLFFIYSRRTPQHIKKIISNVFQSESFILDEISENLYLYLIKHSDFFIVSSDSVSMTMDALSTLRPVFIFRLKKIKRKICNFQDYLIEQKLTREFYGKIYCWKHKELSEGERIAKKFLVELSE